MKKSSRSSVGSTNPILYTRADIIMSLFTSSLSAAQCKMIDLEKIRKILSGTVSSDNSATTVSTASLSSTVAPDFTKASQNIEVILLTAAVTALRNYAEANCLFHPRFKHRGIIRALADEFDPLIKATTTIMPAQINGTARAGAGTGLKTDSDRRATPTISSTRRLTNLKQELIRRTGTAPHFNRSGYVNTNLIPFITSLADLNERIARELGVSTAAEDSRLTPIHTL